MIGCVETLQDISERKTLELACRESERRLAEILAATPVATFVLDQDCRVTHWNRACEALTGVTAAETVGRDEAWRHLYAFENRRVVLAELIVRGADPPPSLPTTATAPSPRPWCPAPGKAKISSRLRPPGRPPALRRRPCTTCGRGRGAIETHRHRRSAMTRSPLEPLANPGSIVLSGPARRPRRLAAA